MDTAHKGAHEWMIEFEKEPGDFERFKELLDRHLQKLNSDYEAKRYKNMTLEPPISIKPVPDYSTIG